MQIMTIASHWVGFTFPGMIDDPGSLSGNSNSPRPHLGPDASHRMSLAIFINATANPRNVAEVRVIASSDAWAANLFGAVTNGLPVSAAILAAMFAPNLSGR
jgi:hypothetical protein